MFEMIIYLISTVSACELITSNINIYPTEGELYTLPLSKLFGGNNLNYSCTGCTSNIILWNSFNTINQRTSQYVTQSLSSNSTHFVTLTTQLTINLYIYEKNEMNLQCLIQIEPHLQCFNSIFTQTNNILIDCYNSNNNSLQFYCLKICEFSLFQIISNENVPIKTKMRTFFSGSETYLLYAQFYQKYQLLTIFSFKDRQLINQTTWTLGLNDFDVSYRFIYIIYNNSLYQLSITQQSQLSNLSLYQIFPEIKVNYIKVQNEIFYESVYDYIYLVSYNKYQQLQLRQFEALNGSIIEKSFFLDDNSFGTSRSSVQILISNLFLILQIDNIIYRVQNFQNFPNLINFTSQNQTILQLSYLDYFTNLLYQFSDQIIINQLQIPQIEISFKDEKELSPFIIEGYSGQEKLRNNTCYLKVLPIALKSNDIDIYLMKDLPQEIYFLFQNSYLTFNILGFSGPLMKTSIVMLNEQLGEFQDQTFVLNNYQFPFTFEVSNFRPIDGIEALFLAGFLNGNIYFYLCLQLAQCNYVHSDIGLQNTAHIAMIFFNRTMIVGINQGVTDIRIYYFSVWFNETHQTASFGESLIYNFPAYKQFILTYDNIIVLLQSQKIIIHSLTTSDQFTLNDEEMAKLFFPYDRKSINFKPISIAMNEADLSAILFINNQKSVLIVVVQSTYIIIPYGIFYHEHRIYQLNVMIYQLIVSFNCESKICFEVWDIMDLRKPCLVKNLPALQMSSGWVIKSDNRFLYIRSQAKSIYVLNPALSYHSSLYYEFNLTGNFLSSYAIINVSLILLGNQFYNLSGIMIQKFEPDAYYYGKQQKYVSQTLFYVSVGNKFFSNITSPNKLLSIINPLTEISLPQNYSVHKQINVPFVISLDPETYKTSAGQILAYKLIDKEKKKICTLQNYIQQNDLNKSNVSLIYSPLWLFMINKTLIMQSSLLNKGYCFDSIKTNNSEWQHLSCGQNDYTNCSMPLVNQTNKSNQIYQICQFKGKWYLTEFEYFQQNSTINITQNIAIGINLQNVNNLTSINNTIFFFQASEGIYFTNNINNVNITTNSIQYNKLVWGEVSYYTLEQLKYFQDYYLLIYIQEEILYVVGTVNQEQEFELKGGIQKLFQTTQYFSLGDAQVLQIQIVQQLENKLILFLTTNIAPCFIFEASYFYIDHDTFTFSITFDQIIQTIPPYGNYQLKYSTQIIQDLRLFVYASDKDKIYAIYDLSSVHKNITSPLIMRGGINLTVALPTSLAFNFSSIQDGGLIYDIVNEGVNNYQVLGQASLNCMINQRKNYTFSLIAYNSFSNDTIKITIQGANSQEWYIGLIIILAIVLFIATIFFQINTRGLDKESNLVEEIELE